VVSSPHNSVFLGKIIQPIQRKNRRKIRTHSHSPAIGQTFVAHGLLTFVNISVTEHMETHRVLQTCTQLSYILIWLRSDQSDVLTIGQPTLSYCSKAHSFLLCNQLSSGISREFNHSATDHWSAPLAKILINYMNPKPLHASFLAKLYNQKFVFWTWFATYCGQFMQLLTRQKRLLHFMMTSDIVNIHNYSLDIAADGYSVFFWVVSPFFGM